MNTPIKAGIQETKDAMIAINEVGLTMVQLFADGAQFQDVMQIWKKLSEDETFKAQLAAAYEGWSSISGEISDLDVNEALELVTVQLAYIPKFVDVIKKDTPATPVANPA
jgi:hypothetical protein